MTSSLVEKIASLKANFPQEESQSSNEAYILLASQLIHDSQSVHEVNRALLGAAVDKSSDVTQIAQPIQDYFFVLFEWYKTGVDTLKLPLLSHLPICLYIEFSNKRHPLVEGTVLCIYNCEVVSRASSGDRKLRLFTSLHSNQKCIYNVADVNNLYNFGSNISDTASTHSGSGTQLTQGALHSFNRNQQQIQSEMKGTSKRDSKLSFVSSSIVACIPVVLQVFISYLDTFETYILVDLCNLIYRVLSGGMPYAIPSFAAINSFRQADIQNTELQVEQITLVDENISPRMERRKSLIADSSARQKYTHLQLFQLALNGSKQRGDNSDWPRVNLNKDIVNELLTIVKYCVFSVDHMQDAANTIQHTIFYEERKNTDVRALVFSSLYAIHLRALYEQIPELLLYTRSILNVV